MLLHRPPLKDMSFVTMSKDLEEVMNQLSNVAGKSFKMIDRLCWNLYGFSCFRSLFRK